MLTATYWEHFSLIPNDSLSQFCDHEIIFKHKSWNEIEKVFGAHKSIPAVKYVVTNAFSCYRNINSS